MCWFSYIAILITTISPWPFFVIKAGSPSWWHMSAILLMLSLRYEMVLIIAICTSYSLNIFVVILIMNKGTGFRWTCYERMMNNMIRQAVGAIIEKHGKYLLVNYR